MNESGPVAVRRARAARGLAEERLQHWVAEQGDWPFANEVFGISRSGTERSAIEKDSDPSQEEGQQKAA